MGGAPKVPVPKAPDTGQEYAGAIKAYLANAPALYKEEAQYQPMYNLLNQQQNQANISAYAQQYFSMLPEAETIADRAQINASATMLQNLRQFGPAATQAALSSNPVYGQLQGLANQQLGAGPNQTLQGILGQVQGALPQQVQQFSDLASQTGQDVTGVNQALQGLAQKAGAETSAADLARIRDQVVANTRTADWQTTGRTIMGQVGQLDPLTQQLKDTASSQLALGGQISQQEAQDVAQQARAAFSARGMMQSNPSVAAEFLNRDVYQQQRLQQREAFASGVSQLADTQAQERLANAMGFTQADLQATMANQQAAAQMTQGIAGLNQAQIAAQSGLQQAIAGNLAQARQTQAGLLQQATGTFQSGMQQAAGLQGSILDELYRQQAAGQAGLQYLGGVGSSYLSGVLGAQDQSANLPMVGFNANQYGTGGPDLFQSSGVLSLMNQNQMAQMNATSQANMVNAQSRGASQGAMIGAGASIAGALIGGVAIF